MAVDQERLRRVLDPSSVTVVGDKAPMYGWLTRQKEFDGPLYSVQVDPKEIAGIEERGFTNFTSLADVPGDIDLVICAVPRAITPRIVADCAARGVGGIAMFTSGFAETGEPDAIELQRQIVEIANDAGMPIVGPNCLGVYNRRVGVRFGDDQIVGGEGNVAVAGQSGTNSSGLISAMQRIGLKVGRGVSYGNAVVVNECDYLEYYLADPAIEVIVMYVEGLKDARRFFELLREGTKRKPVVLWRGGQTEAGARAVQSHTASLASSVAVWQAMLEQTNAIGTGSLEETVDVASVLVNTAPSTGRDIALIGMNGGQAVALTDQFSLAGFRVPQLSEASYQQLASFFMAVGSSYRNPFDAASTIRGEDDNLAKILEIIGQDDVINGGVALELGARDLEDGAKELDRMLELLEKYRTETGEPVLALMHDQGGGRGGAAAMVRAREYVGERGFAVTPSYHRGAQALGRAVTYYERRAAMGA
ncbi:MAG: CoA-binding protein [Dehalococcoidia bacterium]